MASSSKRKGSVRTLSWAKSLKKQAKRWQESMVRSDAKRIIQGEKKLYSEDESDDNE